jgi:hypothetical protein
MARFGLTTSARPKSGFRTIKNVAKNRLTFRQPAQDA